MLRFRAPHLPVWLALATSLSVPFLVALHTYPIPTFYSEFATALCWIAAAVGVLALTWRGERVVPVVVLAPFGLVVVLLIQLAVQPPLNPFFSFAGSIYLLAAAAVCGLGARCRSVPGTLEAIAIAVITGGLATFAVEILQLLRVPGLPDLLISMAPQGAGRRMWGNLNQPNHVGSYLAFGLAATLFLAQTRRRWCIPLIVMALALLAGMALTVSRTSWLLVIVVGLLAGWVRASGRYGARKWIEACVPLVLLVLAYQMCDSLVAYGNLRWHWDLPVSLAGRVQEGVGLRPLLWRHAWHMFLTHPLLGGGWGDYAWNQYVQTDVLGHVEMSMNAHNIILDLLAKAGLVGLLAVSLPLLGFIRLMWRRRITPELAFVYAIVLVLAVHSMLEYPLHYLYFLLPFAFAIGYADERNLRMPSNSMSWVLTGVVTVCSAVLAVRMWGDYKSVERLYYPQESPRAELQRYQASGQLLLVPYGNLTIANNAAINYETAPVMAAVEHQAVQFYPSSGPVQRYAVALAFQGKTDEAIVQVRRLHSQYWMEYANQSQLLTNVCAKESVILRTFCARLRSENLLAGAG
ncbi:Wzy polymerase domain-containing protein [Ralstonia sp. Ralssp110]|uniref:PglL family O-oligosaccharyltransferase n=1 Tax=Ralstonia sp. Ralssp110 TaxID=3243004 RepID=UPI0039B575DC